MTNLSMKNLQSVSDLNVDCMYFLFLEATSYFCCWKNSLIQKVTTIMIDYTQIKWKRKANLSPFLLENPQKRHRKNFLSFVKN